MSNTTFLFAESFLILNIRLERPHVTPLQNQIYVSSVSKCTEALQHFHTGEIVKIKDTSSGSLHDSFSIVLHLLLKNGTLPMTSKVNLRWLYHLSLCCMASVTSEWCFQPQHIIDLSPVPDYTAWWQEKYVLMCEQLAQSPQSLLWLHYTTVRLPRTELTTSWYAVLTITLTTITLTTTCAKHCLW